MKKLIGLCAVTLLLPVIAVAQGGGGQPQHGQKTQQQQGQRAAQPAKKGTG